MKRRGFIALGIALLGALSPTPDGARAAGLIVSSGQGSEATMRGLAYVAKADGLDGLFFNPAGLAEIHRHRFGFSVQFVTSEIAWDREDGLVRPDGTVAQSPEESPFPTQRSRDQDTLGQLGYATDLNRTLPFTIGVGWNTLPTEGAIDFAVEGPNRYELTRSAKTIHAYRLGVGWSIPGLGDHLMLGASIGGKLLDRSFGRKVSADLHGFERPRMDLDMLVETRDSFALDYAAGVLFDVSDHIRFGVSYQSPIEFKSRGVGTLSPAMQLQVNEEGNTVTVPIMDPVLEEKTFAFDAVAEDGLPETIRVGARYHRETWDIEFDYILMRWSAVPERSLWFENVRLAADSETAVDQAALEELLGGRVLGEERNDRDVSAYALGGSLKVHPFVTVRLGAHYQERATQRDLIDPAYPDAQRWIASGGIRYDWGYLTMDAGVAMRFDQPVESKESEKTSIHSLERVVGPQLRTRIGRGEYSAQSVGLIFGIQLSF